MLPLGEHAGDRMRGVAEAVGDLADPQGRLRREPVGAVECERDGRLRHARLSGDICDARTETALLHSVRTPRWGVGSRGIA